MNSWSICQLFWPPPGSHIDPCHWGDGRVQLKQAAFNRPRIKSIFEETYPLFTFPIPLNNASKIGSWLVSSPIQFQWHYSPFIWEPANWTLFFLLPNSCWVLFCCHQEKNKKRLGWSDNSLLGGQPGLFGGRWWHRLPSSRKQNKGLRLRASGRAKAAWMFVQYSATVRGAASESDRLALAIGLHLKHLKTPQGPEGLKLETLRVGARGGDFYIIKNGLYYRNGLPGIAEMGSFLRRSYCLLLEESNCCEAWLKDPQKSPSQRGSSRLNRHQQCRKGHTSVLCNLSCPAWRWKPNTISVPFTNDSISLRGYL